MSLFKQKPAYASRPFEWLYTDGQANRSSIRRFFRQLEEEISTWSESTDKNPSSNLLAYRNEFRRIIADEPTISLCLQLDNPNPFMRSLTVWLLSHRASRFQLCGIDALCYDPSPLVRKHVAKALRRLEAWPQLEAMASFYPEDQKLQFYARPRTNSVPYHERLARYSQMIDSTQPIDATQPSRMPLWFRDHLWQGAPAKSLEFIRRILTRISEAVHGNGTT